MTVRGYRYRSTVASMGGRLMLPVSAEVREAAGVAAGQNVDVEVELDTAPREVTVPADLAGALSGDTAARRFFEGLSFSNKQRTVDRSRQGSGNPLSTHREAISSLREGRI